MDEASNLKQATCFHTALSARGVDNKKWEQLLHSTRCNQLWKLKFPLKDVNSKDAQQYPALGKSSCTTQMGPETP